MASTCTLSLCIRDILSILLMLTYTLSTLKVCGCDANLACLTLYFHLICTSLFSATGRGQDMFRIILKTMAENYPLWLISFRIFWLLWIFMYHVCVFVIVLDLWSVEEWYLDCCITGNRQALSADYSTFPVWLLHCLFERHRAVF